MWSGLGSPVSCWKDQEPHYREALWAAGKNRKHSLPAPRPPPHHSACEVNLGWLFIDRDSMGSPPSISTEYQLPSNLVSTHWESLVLLGLTQWEVWKLILFKQKEEKDCPAPPTPQTAVPLPNRPSWSGTNMAKLLWPGGGLISPPVGCSDWGGAVSRTGCYEFKGDPQLYQSPRHLNTSYFDLLRNPLWVWHWFQISWTGNLIWVKSCDICKPTNYSSHPLGRWKQIQNNI